MINTVARAIPNKNPAESTTEVSGGQRDILGGGEVRHIHLFYIIKIALPLRLFFSVYT